MARALSATRLPVLMAPGDGGHAQGDFGSVGLSAAQPKLGEAYSPHRAGSLHLVFFGSVITTYSGWSQRCELMYDRLESRSRGQEPGSLIDV